ncbi:hypothetical protein FRC06_004553, partial [Ceratobasidium sp. 370]
MCEEGSGAYLVSVKLNSLRNPSILSSKKNAASEPNPNIISTPHTQPQTRQRTQVQSSQSYPRTSISRNILVNLRQTPTNPQEPARPCLPARHGLGSATRSTSGTRNLNCGPRRPDGTLLWHSHAPFLSILIRLHVTDRKGIHHTTLSARRFLSTTGDVALQLLRLTAASADAFPPLKSAAGGALHIAEIVKKFHSNKTEWREFGDYVRDATASVVQSLAEVDASRGNTRSKLEKLSVTLDETAKTIESERALPGFKRAVKFMQDPELIADMRRRVDDAISLFQ